MSAQRVYEYGTGLRTGGLLTCTAASGGTRLSGVAVFSLTLLNISGNAPVWVGGRGLGSAPVSGNGLILYPSTSLELRVDNAADVSVFAETSGQKISWLGVAR